MAVDGQLPHGLAANTAAILGITLGRRRPQIVGTDVCDGEGRAHLGIIEFPVLILCAVPEQLKTLREQLYRPEFSDVTAVDFSDLAQGCKTYGEFTGKMAAAPQQRASVSGACPLRPPQEGQQAHRQPAAAAVRSAAPGLRHSYTKRKPPRRDTPWGLSFGAEDGT